VYDLTQKTDGTVYLCSWEDITMKKKVCKELEEFDVNAWRLFNDAALEKKFNDLFKKYSKCLSTK
jgi:hypothetical protein